MFSLNYAPPADDLREFISSYYVFRAELPAVTDVMRADFAQIRFLLRGSGFYRFGDGRVDRCPAAMVTGPTSAALAFNAIGPLEVFGISLLPAGWAAFIGCDSSELADRVEDASAIFGSLIHEIYGALGSTGNFETRASIANVALRALLHRNRQVPGWFTSATESWLTGALSPEIDELMRTTGLSARQLERMTNRIYGAPPKLLARKYRALRAASSIGAGHGDWQDVAGEAFYDQSHFIREFRRFVGMTPSAFQNAPPPVTRLTLERRKLVGTLPRIILES